ncbi:hypothetical protein [Pimelobacter simplex]|uniref:hypothetical protein n=1 Tax=Nocardioides simplex TaxID=2045 RepID=UPI003AAB6970
MRPLVVPTLLLAAVLTGCGTEATTGATTSPTATPPAAAATATTTAGPTRGPTGIKAPPPFRVRYDDRELALHPDTYCVTGGCVDGVIADPPEVGSPAELLIHVPVARFRLQPAGLTEVTSAGRAGRSGRFEGCRGRVLAAPVEDLGGGWYRLRPFGPAGTYDVSLFASGRGDMAGTLRWTMPQAGPMPTPAARLALIADHDGQPDSYGLELSVTGLAASPRQATAEIEVRAGNGRGTTITARRSRGSCVGDLGFDGPDAPARAASRLGGFPFTMRVMLTLDGVRHVATAVYPDDEIDDNEPYVALEFTPALPGL